MGGKIGPTNVAPTDSRRAQVLRPWLRMFGFAQAVFQANSSPAQGKAAAHAWRLKQNQRKKKLTVSLLEFATNFSAPKRDTVIGILLVRIHESAAGKDCGALTQRSVPAMGLVLGHPGVARALLAILWYQGSQHGWPID